MRQIFPQLAIDLRFICWITLVVLATYCAVSIDHAIAAHALFRDSRYAGDFTVFWTAGRSSPDIVYDIKAISRAQEILIGDDTGPRPFLNPPSLLPFLAPIALLPFAAAWAAWTAAGLLSFVQSVRQWIKIRHFALISVSPPFFWAVAVGQVTLFITACSVAALSTLKTRPTLAGVLIGLAATIKPQAVFLAPLALIAGRHWRTLGTAAATGAAIGLACLVLQGPQLWLDWLSALGQFTEISQRAYLIRRGATPTSLAFTLGLSGDLALSLIICGAILGISTVWIAFRTTEDFLVRLTAMVAGSLLCIPYAMPYEAIPLLIPAAVMLLDRKANPLEWGIGFILVSGLLLPVAVIIAALATLFRAVRSDTKLKAAIYPHSKTVRAAQSE